MLDFSLLDSKKKKKILQTHTSDQIHQTDPLSNSYLELHNCCISTKRLSLKLKYIGKINKPRYNLLLLQQLLPYCGHQTEYLPTYKEFHVFVRMMQGPWMEMP